MLNSMYINGSYFFQARSPFWSDPLVTSPPPAHMTGKFYLKLICIFSCSAETNNLKQYEITIKAFKDSYLIYIINHNSFTYVSYVM